MEKITEVKKTPTVKVIGEIVTLCHNTKTLDGDAWFTTAFDFTNVPHTQLLIWAADGRKIAWRATTGIKKLTTEEITNKGLLNVNVDCSKTAERVKHVETEEEKELKATIAALLSGKGGQKLTMAELAKRLKEMHEPEENDEEVDA